MSDAAKTYPVVAPNTHPTRIQHLFDALRQDEEDDFRRCVLSAVAELARQVDRAQISADMNRSRFR